MRFDRALTRCAAAVLLCGAAGCLPDARLKLGLDDVPVARGDWSVATPEDAGFDRAALRAAYARFFSPTDLLPALSLLVARNGVLVAEGYARDRADIDRLGAIQSATKSVTSMLAGIARDKGFIDDLDRPLVSYLPSEYDLGSQVRAITVRHLLTMRSGIDFPNGPFTIEMAWHVSGDGLAYMLRKPLSSAPGEQFVYKDVDPTIMGDLLQKRTGMTLAAFADAYLFGPLGIVDYVWTRHNDGLSYGAYGLYLKPRDLLKLGQLMLDGGSRAGQPVVPAAWVAESTTTRTTLPATGQPNPLDFTYGYYWWVIGSRGAYSAYGHGGQYVYVIPAKHIVIAFTAEPDTSGDEPTGLLETFVALADLIAAAAR